MLNKPFGDIAHWKGMIFAGQNVVEFSGANYSPYEYVYEIPYVQYQDESIYFSNEPDVVQSLMRRFDDVWMNDVYTFYANPVVRARSYPESYTIAPEFNLPPDDSYTSRLLPLLDAETEGIDVVMFRITDPRPADALIRAVARGVPVRLYAEPLEYRNPARREDAYNVDRMYMAGVRIKMRAHAGQNHQKTVQLAGQHTTIFGTSNWSTASDDNQLEVNYFTTKDWFYQFFADQFDWKWNNRPPDGSTSVQTADFVPLPPNPPKYQAPANLASGVSPGSVTLSWYAGDWARKYDLYLGVGSNPELHTADVNLGPQPESRPITRASPSQGSCRAPRTAGRSCPKRWRTSRRKGRCTASRPLACRLTIRRLRRLIRQRPPSSSTRPRRAPPCRARRGFPQAHGTTSPSPVFNSSWTASSWGRKTEAPPTRCRGTRGWRPLARTR